ncbi:MAG: hydroxymethylbilane synthase [Bacteroidetes bacterium]|nr:hydroxymethylbilane synthase [Bacteroidota bacterium]
MEKKVLTIGTRGSDLALWQAKFIKKEIEKNHKDVKVELKLIKTKGDKIVDVALSKIGDKSLFTKELENELLEGTIDIAVHSLKDLETKIPKGLVLAAVTKRHAVDDVLIAREKKATLDSLKIGATVATGSLRRQAQLLHYRPDIKVVDLRGNVPTRIEKFLNSKWDAIILARAGVERLKLKKHISSILPQEVFLPAVGQGALGIEISSENTFAAKIIKVLNDENTFAAVRAEREFLKTLQGGCQVPIGAHAEATPKGLFLEGMVASLDGTITFRKKARGSKTDPEKLGKELAKELLKAGARKVLKEIYNTPK